MYGWKARLGIIPTMDDSVLEPELNYMAPEGVAVYASRMTKPSADVNVETQSFALDSLERCVDELVLVRPQVICVGSTSVSFVKGADQNKAIIDRIERRSGGIPGTTVSNALLQALKTLGSKRLSIVTPYIEELNQKEKVFLESFGFEVLNIKGMQLLSSDDICNLACEEIYQFAIKNFDLRADTLVFSCTGLHTAPIVESVERNLMKPTISSNTVALWNMLRIAGVNERISGFGRLLSEH